MVANMPGSRGRSSWCNWATVAPWSQAIAAGLEISATAYFLSGQGNRGVRSEVASTRWPRRVASCARGGRIGHCRMNVSDCRHRPGAGAAMERDRRAMRRSPQMPGSHAAGPAAAGLLARRPAVRPGDGPRAAGPEPGRQARPPGRNRLTTGNTGVSWCEHGVSLHVPSRPARCRACQRVVRESNTHLGGRRPCGGIGRRDGWRHASPASERQAGSHLLAPPPGPPVSAGYERSRPAWREVR